MAVVMFLVLSGRQSGAVSLWTCKEFRDAIYKHLGLGDFSEQYCISVPSGVVIISGVI